jgi:hypothetical protein
MHITERILWKNKLELLVKMRYCYEVSLFWYFIPSICTIFGTQFGLCHNKAYCGGNRYEKIRWELTDLQLVRPAAGRSPYEIRNQVSLVGSYWWGAVCNATTYKKKRKLLRCRLECINNAINTITETLKSDPNNT